MFLNRYASALFCLLVVGTPAVLAQPVNWSEFYPLHEPDRWVYRYTEEQCNEELPPVCVEEEAAFIERVVIGEFPGNQAVMTVDLYDRLGEVPTCSAEYGVWFDDSRNQVRTTALEGICDPAFGDGERQPLGTQSPGETTIDIGGFTYSAVTVEEAGQADVSYQAVFARGIGMVRSTESLANGGGSQVTTYALQYAEVGGVTYGTLAVESASEPVPVPFALGFAYPNPFSSTTTLALSAPFAETVMVEVFDVLGRRVLERALAVQPAGTQRITLDLQAVPAGAYFVRATTSSGQTATRRIVRTD